MSFLTNMKTRSKLLTSFIFMAILVTALGLVSIKGIKDVKTDLQSMFDDRLVPAVDLGKVSNYLSNLRIGALRIMSEQDEEKQQAIFNEAAEDEKSINEVIEKYAATYLVPEGKKVLDEFKAAWKA